MKYDLVSSYGMKCRLYPNKEMSRIIDRIFNGVHKAYNITNYETRKPDSPFVKEYRLEDGGVLHYADFDKLGKKEHLDWLREQHLDIHHVPAYALSGNDGVFRHDFKVALSHKEITTVTKDGHKKKTHEKKARKGGRGYKPYSIEEANADYFSKSNPRLSYSCQQLCNSICKSDNPKVFYIKLTNVGMCKVRGWNQNIRFDHDGSIGFLEYCEQNPDKRITTTVSKDKCGDYYISFKLSGVYKPMGDKSDKRVGIDVGIKDLMTVSDKTVYGNPHFKAKEKDHIKALNRRLSRRQGWSNKEFRDNNKNHDLTVSKRYKETKLKLSRLHRKIARKREIYNHRMTREVVENNWFIGVETLNVTDMYKNKRLAKILADAAMGEILRQIKYKGTWHGRIVQPVGKWFPSSKKCRNCGYILPKLSLSTREWTCPQCGEQHGRDLNSSGTILDEAWALYCAKK